MKHDGLTKHSSHTNSRQKLSGKSKRAIQRGEKQGRMTKQEGRDAKDCVEKGRNCGGKKNRNKNNRNKKCKRNGNCSYSELFAGLHSEDIELMEDYYDRYDEEELEFIADFLLGADHEDDEEYYY